MGDKNIIELNGKVYDTLTGRLINGPKSAKLHTSKPKNSIDGFIAKKADPVRKINTKVAHKPERAKTLMRKAVSKPRLVSKTVHQLQTAAGSERANSIKVETVAARAAINERQLIRSQQVHKSHLINRFRASEKTEKFHRPEKEASKHHAPPPTEQKPKSHALTSAKDDILAIGLAQATSHQEKFTTKPKLAQKDKVYRRRFIRRLSTFIAVLIMLALIGWILDKDLPGMELRVVDWRAGVSAELPGYAPKGFKVMVPIDYSPGYVMITFQYKANEIFTITQQNSNWDSQTLRDSFVILKTSNYQTYQNKGRTIYTFAPGEATWVNGGIWYQINAYSNLTTSQLMNIANSM